MATSARSRSKNQTVAQEFSLADVISATKTGNFVYTPATFHASLVDSGDVEINPEMVDEHGNIATRVTQKHLIESNQMEQATEVKASKAVFAIEDDVPMPEAKPRFGGHPGAGRSAIYPFDTLNVGQSFFVPNKDENHSAFKAMQSTVNSANARYREEIPGTTRIINRGKGAGKVAPDFNQLRRFKAFDTERTIIVDGKEVVQKGARIYRIELKD